MKSSTKNKHKVDDVSRETQRLVMSSSVHLPYHIPKQKSLKDFLNRQKIPLENQVSLTGPKKLLRKAWEFIETKEQNVEKFYNEISIQDEDNEEPKSSSNDGVQTFQTEKNRNFIDLDDNNYNKEKMVVEYDDEENCENSSINSDSSDCDEASSINDDENSKEATSLCSEEFPIQPVEHQDNEKLKHHFNSNKFDDIAKQFIDNEAELSELEESSDDEDSFINSSENEEEIEISKKKKRPTLLLSESSDDEHISDIEIEMTSNDIIPLSNELEKNTPTSLIDNGHNSNTEMKIDTNDLSPLFNESEKNISTQQLMELCSGQFQTQPESQENELEDNFDSSVPLDNLDEDSENDQSDEDEDDMPKLTSVNDFFDDEAELSESDWSSDDENQDAEKLDKLDEEDGDKDELDENLIKDGLDKIYMRQLLDDDIKQVTELKERLLEDGELYSDTGRKRKFQWGDNDQDDDSFKKPLFSDSEDENEVVNGDDGDDLSGLWRKERYKRESYLSQTNDSEDEILPDNCEESGDNSQTSMILAVKKTHVIKLKNEGIFQSKDKSIVVNVNHSDSSNKNKKTENGLTLPCVAKVTKAVCINSQSNKLLKGSFMKRRNVNKIVTLLNMNKNNDQVDSGNYLNKDIRPLTTITAKACNNPFAYMLMDGKKQDNTNLISKEMNTEKNDNEFYNQPSISGQLTEETKKKKNTNSILMHLE
ncbi:Hypothetical protein CINCED_3A012726 [Cinara cedri]|uniref:Claspin n=1 Tax=Cinara cedri TaxID=506608 RepID=A0A5E4M9W1_9HEMI|nr:Hypothetical protein CINCED_3A012726 [Cinara cedri]